MVRFLGVVSIAYLTVAKKQVTVNGLFFCFFPFWKIKSYPQIACGDIAAGRILISSCLSLDVQNKEQKKCVTKCYAFFLLFINPKSREAQEPLTQKERGGDSSW